MKHKNILPVLYIAKALLLFLLIVPLFLLFNLDGSIFSVINSIVSILLVCFAWRLIPKILNKWIGGILDEECDFESYRLTMEKLIKMKRNRNHLKAHLSLFNTYLVLGCYDECQKEINEIDRLSSRMSGMQAIIYGFRKVDYLLETSNNYPDVIKEINQIKETFNKLEKISENEKNVIQNGIMIREYLAEEKWEEVIELLKKSDYDSIYEEVKISYRLGKCYYLIGEYKQAFSELSFASKWGGNTKYVSFANDLIKSIPLDETYDGLEKEKAEKIKTGQWKIYANLLTACFIIGITILVNYHSLHGFDVKEIYCKRYLCKQEEVNVLYQQSYGNYEMAILSDSENEKVAYCLLERVSETSTPRYRMTDYFRINTYLDDHKAELEMMEKIYPDDAKEDARKFFQESEIKQELWAVITGFYKKNSIFYQEDLEYVGISFSPMVENITINGNAVTVEQIIDTTETPVYLWSVENLDLRTDIWVDYAEP